MSFLMDSLTSLLQKLCFCTESEDEDPSTEDSFVIAPTPILPLSRTLSIDSTGTMVQHTNNYVHRFVCGLPPHYPASQFLARQFSPLAYRNGGDRAAKDVDEGPSGATGSSYGRAASLYSNATNVESFGRHGDWLGAANARAGSFAGFGNMRD